MDFKVGDRVRFKRTTEMATAFLQGFTGDFHISHEGETATIISIDYYGGPRPLKSKYNMGFRLDIDKGNRFLFHIERFEKVGSTITIDDNLFTL